MSVEALTWAFESDVGSGPRKGTRKFLLVAVANSADEYGIAFPGRELLATRCCCTPEAITANMGRLEEAGLIARRQRRRKNGSRTSDWIVLAPNHAERVPMLDCPGKEHPDEIAALARCGPTVAAAVADITADPSLTGVYVFLDRQEARVKIGWSKNSIERRRKQLSATLGRPLVFVACVGTVKEQETELHERFAAAYIGQGEWFSLSNEVLDWLDSLNGGLRSGELNSGEGGPDAQVTETSGDPNGGTGTVRGTTTSEDSLRSPSDAVRPSASAEGRTLRSSETSEAPTSLPAAVPSTERQDRRSSAAERNDDPEYVRLANLLADLIEANGSKRLTAATVEEWRRDVRLMVEHDGRTLEQIEAAIRWCQAHTFWRSNVLSMPKLRKQYDQMRLQAVRERTSSRAEGNAAVLARVRGRAA